MGASMCILAYVCKYARMVGMKDTVRTTIVLPRDLLRRAKMRSALTDKSLSQLIAETLERTLCEGPREQAPPLPLGKYDLHISQAPSRKELYAAALRPEMPS